MLQVLAFQVINMESVTEHSKLRRSRRRVSYSPRFSCSWKDSTQIPIRFSCPNHIAESMPCHSIVYVFTSFLFLNALKCISHPCQRVHRVCRILSFHKAFSRPIGLCRRSTTWSGHESTSSGRTRSCASCRCRTPYLQSAQGRRASLTRRSTRVGSYTQRRYLGDRSSCSSALRRSSSRSSIGTSCRARDCPDCRMSVLRRCSCTSSCRRRAQTRRRGRPNARGLACSGKTRYQRRGCSDSILVHRSSFPAPSCTFCRRGAFPCRISSGRWCSCTWEGHRSPLCLEDKERRHCPRVSQRLRHRLSGGRRI
jgi:hypothetical protein